MPRCATSNTTENSGLDETMRLGQRLYFSTTATTFASMGLLLGLRRVYILSSRIIPEAGR